MDESTAIYFRFPPYPTAEFDYVSYVVATSSTSYTDPANLTLLEIVAFMCWRSFVRMGIKFRNFKENPPTTVTARYTSVLNLNTDSQSRKRPQDEGGRVQPKRNKQQPAPQDDDTPIEFDGWHVNALVTLEYLPAATTASASQTRVRAPSRDSGFHEPLHASGNGPRKLRHFLPPLTAAAPTATFCVTQILTPAVAVLSPVTPTPSLTRFAAKIPSP